MLAKTTLPGSGTCLVVVSFIALACIPPRAHSQEWFAGGSLGVAQQDEYEIAGAVTTRDDSDSAFRVFGGYRVSPMHAVVASYVDLGRPSYAGPAFGGFSDALEADGFDLSWVVGWAPGDQNRVALFGTIGVFAFDQEVSLSDSTGTFDFHDEGTTFSVGFGADVNLSSEGTSRWSLHVDYQLFKDVGDVENSGFDLDREMASVGVAYRFGPRD